MKIGLGFIHRNFFVHTSESVLFRSLGREWIKLGHEVYFVHVHKHLNRLEKVHKDKKFVRDNKDLIPLVVSYDDARLEHLDVICELVDYRCMGKYLARRDTSETNYYSKARLKSGIFGWALSPLSEYWTKKLVEYRYPVFIVGTKSYKEAINFGLDVNLFIDGIDLSVFNCKEISRSDKTKFIWVGGCGAASAPDILLTAYFEEFTSKDNVSLTMICTDRKLRKFLREFVPDREDLPEVVAIEGCQSPIEMASHYGTHDALVMPIRFHSTCRPIMEAMACGAVVITTPWTGPTDFAGENEALWIDYKIEGVIEASKKLESRYTTMGSMVGYCNKFEGDVTYMWAKPSIGHTSKLMRSVYESNYDKDIVGRALKKAETFGNDKSARRMINVFEEALY